MTNVLHFVKQYLLWGALVVASLSVMLLVVLRPSSSKAKSSHKQSQSVVYGFAPYWTLKKLDNVDFSVLTTFAYFGIPVKSNGTLDRENIGYKRFFSTEARDAFARARNENTDIVITFTQMNNDVIEELLDDGTAKERAANEMVRFVADHDLDGINIDIEYSGETQPRYRHSFTDFVRMVHAKLHAVKPDSTVTVSVYAASTKGKKLYDIAALSDASDSIFMMAYDFATKGSDKLMPTAPLYGHKEGKYWYDISTAVEDFLKVMPPDKLILGVPYYGYNYPVNSPGTGGKIQRGRWIPKAYAQTIAAFADAKNASQIHSGWDEEGKVSWHAYKEGNRWRMVFQEDTKSLTVKYDFAKQNKLAGVGIWALGFDENGTDLWNLLANTFPRNIAYNGKN